MATRDFWLKLDQLLSECPVVVDRPAGSRHPRFPSLSYPLDYGYLAGTRAGDGEGIDIWIGSRPDRTVTAIVCTVDLEQRDAEIKLLVGCTPKESREILAVHNSGGQAALLIRRPDWE